MAPPNAHRTQCSGNCCSAIDPHNRGRKWVKLGRNRRARRVSCTTHNCRSCCSAETFRPVPRTDSCIAAIYSKTSPARTSNVGATAALQFGILASRSCSSIARRPLVRLISARACDRSRLVSATTAFRRSISRRVSETREREETGLSSTDSAHCTATRCASPRLPNAQGLIQGSTADGTLDRSWRSTLQAMPRRSS